MAADPNPGERGVSAVVFDLGGVLIDWDPRRVFRGLLPDDDAVEAFLAEVDFAAWNRRLDAGRTFDEALTDFADRPHLQRLLGSYRERFLDSLGGALDDTVAVLAELRAQPVRLLALTNWSAETFPRARPQFGFLDWFEAIVVSGAEGMIKPDPRLFATLVRRHRLDPAGTIFIDDSDANTRAAAAAGLRAVRFEDAAALRAHLVSEGVLPAGERPPARDRP